MFKLLANGDSAWSKTFGGIKEDFVNKVIQLQNGDILVSGGTKSFDVLQQNLNISYNVLTGVKNFDYPDPGTKDEYYNSCAQSLNGNFVGTGKSTHPIYGEQGLIEVYSSGFSYISFFPIAIGTLDELFSVCKTKDKGFAFVGVTQGTSTLVQDVFFVKTDSTGNYGSNVTNLYSNDKSSFSFMLYPNPAKDYLEIKLKNTTPTKRLKIKLIDVNGKEILSHHIDNLDFQIDLKDIDNGIYFIQLFSENTLVKTEKLAIVK